MYVTWNFESAIGAFDRYRERWDQLNEAYDHHLLMDSRFVGELVRYFASSKTLLGRSTDSGQPGMVLVEPSQPGFWQTFTPSQGILGLIQLGPGGDRVEQVRTLMRSLPGYALSFSLTQQDPEFTGRIALPEETRVERVEYMKTVRLTLAGTFEEYWRGRSKNLTHNLSRQQRRLEEQSRRLELAVFESPGDIEGCIRRYGVMESAGWKAKEGTAISSENSQGMFYRRVMEAYSERGEGVVYELLLDGKTIGSDLCLRRNGVLVILKTTYDENEKGLSPGLLMHKCIFERLFAEGQVKVIEFYGRLRDWHLKWTDEVREMHHLNVYRHDWVSQARGWVKASSRLWTAPKAS